MPSFFSDDLTKNRSPGLAENLSASRAVTLTRWRAAGGNLQVLIGIEHVDESHTKTEFRLLLEHTVTNSIFTQVNQVDNLPAFGNLPNLGLLEPRVPPRQAPPRAAPASGRV